MNFLRRTRTRGSSDLTVSLLLTAAGAAMVGLTVPSMFKSSDTAARTFDKQVQVLERGASSSSGSSNGSTSSFDLAAPGQIQGSSQTQGSIMQGPQQGTQSSPALSQPQMAAPPIGSAWK